MTTTASEADLAQARRLARLGTGLLVLGVVLTVLNVIQNETSLRFLPSFWHVNRTLWWMLGLAAAVGGPVMLARAAAVQPEAPVERPRESDDELGWQPMTPGRRFRTCQLVTRRNCPLCDEAFETLEKYGLWLPPVEVVDTDTLGEEEQARYTNWVPVVIIDDLVRFKGRVDEPLLRRLLNAARSQPALSSGPN